ncbi:MAG: sugar ABC transporter permease, partial [Vallitaleaceae bacterium]|nr:sugar ABC transporter permease [Vallitaleaceae bacterium]
FFVFNYLPLVGIYYAFVDYKPMAGLYGFGSKFIGLDNFEYFFRSGSWLKITFNTLFLNALFIATGLVTQIVMAVSLNEIGNRVFKRFAQSFMFLPNFLSWTVVSVFALSLFGTNDGLINLILTNLGFEKIAFYQQAQPWPFLLVLLKLWKGVGYGTVIYLATISSLGQEMYEAAKVDGASRLQQIFYITIPMLKTTTVVLLVLSVGSIFFGDFGMIYALLGDNPLVRSTTDVIDTFVFRALRTQNDIGMSTAVGLLQSVLGLIMALAVNFVANKIDKNSQVF